MKLRNRHNDAHTRPIAFFPCTTCCRGPTARVNVRLVGRFRSPRRSRRERGSDGACSTCHEALAGRRGAVHGRPVPAGQRERSAAILRGITIWQNALGGQVKFVPYIPFFHANRIRFMATIFLPPGIHLDVAMPDRS
jgi:hypothetical protein